MSMQFFDLDEDIQYQVTPDGKLMIVATIRQSATDKYPRTRVFEADRAKALELLAWLKKQYEGQ